MRKRPQSPAAEELALPTKRLGGAAWRRARVAKELEAAAAQEKALPGGAAAAEPDAALPHTSSQEADEPQEAYGPPKRSHEKKAHSRVYETGAAWRLTRGLSPVSDEAEMLLPEAEALAAEEGLTLVQSAASNTGYLGVSSRPGTPHWAGTLDYNCNRSATHAFGPRLAQRATSSGRRSQTYPAVSSLPSASVRARAALTVAEPATARTTQPATARTPGKINRGVGYGALVVARALGPQRCEWVVGRGVGLLRGPSRGWCVRCSPHGSTV